MCSCQGTTSARTRSGEPVAPLSPEERASLGPRSGLRPADIFTGDRTPSPHPPEGERAADRLKESIRRAFQVTVKRRRDRVISSDSESPSPPPFGHETFISVVSDVTSGSDEEITVRVSHRQGVTHTTSIPPPAGTFTTSALPCEVVVTRRAEDTPRLTVRVEQPAPPAEEFELQRPSTVPAFVPPPAQDLPQDLADPEDRLVIDEEDQPSRSPEESDGDMVVLQEDYSDLA